MTGSYTDQARQQGAPVGASRGLCEILRDRGGSHAGTFPEEVRCGLSLARSLEDHPGVVPQLLEPAAYIGGVVLDVVRPEAKALTEVASADVCHELFEGVAGGPKRTGEIALETALVGGPVDLMPRSA